MQQVKEDPELERVKRIVRSMLERTQDNGCSEAEALLAAEKVGQLMEQYELKLTDIMVRETKCVQREVYAADRHAQSIISGCGVLCTLKTYHKGGQTVTTFILFGHPHDVELAIYLYEVCAEALDNDYAADQKIHGYSVAKRNSFRQGFAERIYSRMSQLRDKRDAERRARMPTSGCTDLVVLKNQLVTQEFDALGVKLVYTEKKVADERAFRRGLVAGDSVNLNSPLENARKDEGRLA